ncbi:Bifunctional inhibitor/plant lipid transfer protein/seed storage helical domain containing protein [Trema orientale]|uniref:Bifunctional inhibitor/plant lipid transfer protein/seed storage helical domain containing protein n=1 Tax=Trema orientale TaxID=63057 RepID=A0A2P5BQW5_TREOI|nr:Bifunctional inhibitor/plant lipid transfer protein/seed storage helical domain containing protein [Trema orientale]
MAKSNVIMVILAMSAITGLLLSGDKKLVGGVGFGCSGDVIGVATNCFIYVQKLPPISALPALPKLPFPMPFPVPKFEPSTKCCQSIDVTDVPCICEYIPTFVESRIDMARFVSVTAYCGKMLPRGSKCGSKQN